MLSFYNAANHLIWGVGRSREQPPALSRRTRGREVGGRGQGSHRWLLGHDHVHPRGPGVLVSRWAGPMHAHTHSGPRCRVHPSRTRTWCRGSGFPPSTAPTHPPIGTKRLMGNDNYHRRPDSLTFIRELVKTGPHGSAAPPGLAIHRLAPCRAVLPGSYGHCEGGTAQSLVLSVREKQGRWLPGCREA